jgi:hypothetical protein
LHFRAISSTQSRSFLFRVRVVAVIFNLSASSPVHRFPGPLARPVTEAHPGFSPGHGVLFKERSRSRAAALARSGPPPYVRRTGYCSTLKRRSFMATPSFG